MTHGQTAHSKRDHTLHAQQPLSAKWLWCIRASRAISVVKTASMSIEIGSTAGRLLRNRAKSGQILQKHKNRLKVIHVYCTQYTPWKPSERDDDGGKIEDPWRYQIHKCDNMAPFVESFGLHDVTGHKREDSPK